MTRSTDPLLTLPDKSGVLYVRLYQRMRALILEGSWPSGMRLPSSRTLAADLAISRNTVTLALDQLLADGWIETRSRSGTFVSGAVRMPSAGGARAGSARPGKLPVPFELSSGAVDVFPFDRWAKLQAQVWSRFAPDLLYESDLAGDPGLRQAISTVVAPALGLSAAADDIVIVTSTQNAFELIAASLPAGGSVVVGDPGYIHADDAFERRGLKVVPTAIDADGLNVGIARAAAPSPAMIIATTATLFPLGTTVSAPRRRELLDWANVAGAWIIDDLFDSEAVFDDAPATVPLRSESGSEQVVTVYSFSRTLFRSLRLGFMVVPPALWARLVQIRASIDSFVPLPDQLVLKAFIERGWFSAHQRRCRDIHRERRDALLALLEPYRGSLLEPEFNRRGLYLVVRPRRLPAALVAEALRASGIACTTLGELTRAASTHDGILLGFAAFSPDVIAAMGPALAHAFERLSTSS